MINNKIYHRLFCQDKDGAAVFEELKNLFHDRPSYVRGDTHETAFKEGQRSVIAVLTKKCIVEQEEN